MRSTRMNENTNKTWTPSGLMGKDNCTGGQKWSVILPDDYGEPGCV
jgi:hypothetical protein